MALARARTDESQMKAFRDNFGGQSAEKLPGIFVLLRKKKGDGEGFRGGSRGGECRTQRNHSAFLGEVIRFIVEMFAERQTRKGPTFKSVKDVPGARCMHRDLQISRHRCQTAV